ncbi:MAG: trypsin-like serine protease [Chitinophagaceae bacterium]|nr:trypsin-like serine protease [Oligoflexus sp.]
MKILLRSLVVMTLFAAGCHRSTAGSTSEEKIVRGREVKEGSPAFLSAVRVEMGGGLCTGSIIGPRLILTAAHCVGGVSADQIKVFFDKFPIGDKNNVRKAVKLDTFKPFGADLFPNFDVAWIQLDEDVPAPYTPAEILRDPGILSTTTPILLAGYGKQADVCVSADCVGQLREANTAFENYYDKAHIMSLLVFHGPAELGLGGACNGDSGGPAYAQVGTKWYLIGVTNGTRSDITPQSDNLCNSGWDIYTYAGAYVSWLEKDTGTSLKHDDVTTNLDPAVQPLVVRGLSQTTKPTSWAEWINYANHSDPAYYTVDSIVQYLAYDSGIQGAGKTAVLYDPALTIEKAATTTSLYLSGTTVTDLTPLNAFYSLKDLTLDTTGVTDLSALSNKSTLTSIGIRKFGDAAPDTVINTLGAARKNIEDFVVESISATVLGGTDWSTFSKLKNLAFGKTVGTLDLSKIKPRLIPNDSELAITDTAVTGQLKLDRFFNSTLTLQSLISGDATGLGDKFDWLSLASLKALTLDNFDAAALPNFQTFAGLKSLTLRNNGLTTLANIALPTLVDTVDVSGNKLSTLDFEAPTLATLKAYDNPLQTSHCPAKNCQIDIFIAPNSFDQYCANASAAFKNQYEEPFYGLLLAVQSKVVAAEGLDCTALSAGVAGLAALNLSSSQLKDIRPLGYLTSLRILSLDVNAIEDFSPLTNLKMLETLSMESNNLRTLSSLAGMTKLSSLDVLDNPITAVVADGPALKRLFVGPLQTPPEGPMAFALSIGKDTPLDGLYAANLNLSAESLQAIHATQTLRVLYFIDNRIINSADWGDMVNLVLVGGSFSTPDTCPIVNGNCIAEAGPGGEVSLLGPLLGATTGTRTNTPGPLVYLPGTSSPIQIGTTL